MMKKQLGKILKTKTISLEEFSNGFTKEQKQIAENELRYYDVLMALKQARKRMGYTQQELADKANLPRTTITKLESGKYNPTLNTLMIVASAMNKSLEIQVL